MKNKKVVYLSSPYSKGDVSVNTRFQCQTFDELMNDGIVLPVAPLWSHFQHCMFPRPYKDWIDYDLDMIQAYHACLRLDSTYSGWPQYLISESSGADREVATFKEQGKPVFYNKKDLYKWALE